MWKEQKTAKGVPCKLCKQQQKLCHMHSMNSPPQREPQLMTLNRIHNGYIRTLISSIQPALTNHILVKIVTMTLILFMIPIAIYFLATALVSYDKLPAIPNKQNIEKWSSSINYRFRWVQPILSTGSTIHMIQTYLPLDVNVYFEQALENISVAIENIEKTFQEQLLSSSRVDCEFMAQRVRSDDEVASLQNSNVNETHLHELINRKTRIVQSACRRLETQVMNMSVDRFKWTDSEIEQLKPDIVMNLFDEEDFYSWKKDQIKKELESINQRGSPKLDTVNSSTLQKWSIDLADEVLFYTKHLGRSIAKRHYENRIVWIKSVYLELFVRWSNLVDLQQSYMHAWEKIHTVDLPRDSNTIWLMLNITTLFLQETIIYSWKIAAIIIAIIATSKICGIPHYILLCGSLVLHLVKL